MEIDAQGGCARVGDPGGDQVHRIDVVVGASHVLDVEVEHGSALVRVEVGHGLIGEGERVGTQYTDRVDHDLASHLITGGAHVGPQGQVGLLERCVMGNHAVARGTDAHDGDSRYGLLCPVEVKGGQGQAAAVVVATAVATCRQAQAQGNQQGRYVHQACH